MASPGMTVLAARLATAEGRVDQDDGGPNIRRQSVVDKFGVMGRDRAARHEGKQRRPAGIALVERDARAGGNRVRREHRSEKRRVGREGVRTCRKRWTPSK